MAIDYTETESINDRVADVYMTLWDTFDNDEEFVLMKEEDEYGIAIERQIPGCVDKRFSPIVTKFLGLSAAKKAELDAFQAAKNDGNGLGISLFIWQIAERLATAESFKETYAEATAKAISS